MFRFLSSHFVSHPAARYIGVRSGMQKMTTIKEIEEFLESLQDGDRGARPRGKLFTPA